MHLKKWFNFKYLYQNFKKSKAIIIFLICAIFFINLWMVGINLLSGNYIIDFSALSRVSAIIAFIFPIILAFTLFGFVFRKQEIDFIMAKPINRKQIFWSNICGGIGIILFTILLNTLGFVLLNLLTDLFIPLGVLFDYFIYWVVSYIFIFIVASLGISVAGNRAGAIVIIGLLIFFFPILSYLSFNIKTNFNAKYIACESSECIANTDACRNNINCKIDASDGTYYYYLYNNYDSILTTPVNYYKDLYNTTSVIKTIILTIIYLIGAYYLFKYRKMENSEIGFKNKYLYKVIKIIAYIPVLGLAYLLFDSDSVFLLVSIIICLGYFFIFDLVIDRNIKYIFKTLAEFIVVTFLFIIIYYVYYNIYSDSNLTLSVPNEVVVSYQEQDLLTNYEVVVKDKELINEMIKVDNSGDNYIQIQIDNNYYLDRTINEELYDKLIDYVNTNDLNDGFNTDNIIHITSSITPKLVIPNTKDIKEKITNYLNNYESVTDIDCYITLYKYEDHEIKTAMVNVEGNLELFNIVKNYYNASFLDNVTGVIHVKGLENDPNIKLLDTKRKALLDLLWKHKHGELTEDMIMLYSGLDRFYIDRDVFMNDFLMKYGDEIEE